MTAEPAEIVGDGEIEDEVDGVVVGIVRDDATGALRVGLQVFNDFAALTPDEARRIAASIETATPAFSLEFPLVARDLRVYADEVEQRTATRQ